MIGIAPVERDTKEPHPYDFHGLTVLAARDGQLDLIGGTVRAYFQQVDPSGAEYQPVPFQFPAGVTDAFPTAGGYRLYGVLVPVSGPYDIYSIDIDPAGSPTNQATMLGTTPAGQSFAGVGAVPRDKDVSAYVAYGLQGSFTERLIQQCDL